MIVITGPVFVVRRVCKYISQCKAPGPHTEALQWLAQTVNEVYSIHKCSVI